jgi:2'-5' RNA ligase
MKSTRVASSSTSSTKSAANKPAPKKPGASASTPQPAFREKVKAAWNARATLTRAAAGPEETRQALSKAKFEVSKQLFDGTKAKFVSHSDYLALNLPVEPAKTLLTSLTGVVGKLKSRADAHVTVITPPEFAVLKSKLSMKEIEAIAAKANLQGATLKPQGLGMGTAGKDSTYYVVVKSDQLTDLRKELAKAFQAKGGAVGAFDPARYFPHVTIGFTSRDLHESDGVIKDAKSIPNPTGLTVN